ncbi:protein of unknown function [Cyanobium sp. NIES-981]|nr:protein of unknown function [Cyanobium sp. NIES-981]
MDLKQSSINDLAALLKGLKQNYGWATLRGMPVQDFRVLLDRAARTESERNAIREFDEWIGHGLLEVLSSRSSQRIKAITDFTASLDQPKDEVIASIEKLDRAIALTRADRRLQRAGNTSSVLSKTQHHPASRLILVAGIAILIMAGGFAVTVQIEQYRRELASQKKASASQKNELENLKRELEKQKKTEAEKEQVERLAPSNPAPLPRPKLPEAPPAQTAQPWPVCELFSRESPAQSREVWWPVVGPTDSLDAVRRFCRQDAFRNRDGNVQVASFRDREMAAAFADQLNSSRQHPYTFYVGDPTIYD